MGARNNLVGLIFLMAVLAFTVFAAKRLLFRPPAPDPVAALLEKGKPPAKAPQPKPSAALPAPASNGQAQAASTPAAAGTVASAKKEPSPAAKGAVTTAGDHRSEDHRSENHRPQLRLESGARLWIRVTAFNRKPDGSFIFRGTLLQPVDLANANQLEQGTELAGSGTVNDGHVTVLVKAFTVAGANYTLRNDASGSNKRSGTGVAVELNPGKLLEVWLAASSVYRKTP